MPITRVIWCVWALFKFADGDSDPSEFRNEDKVDRDDEYDVEEVDSCGRRQRR